MILETFVPPAFTLASLDLTELNRRTGKTWQYAASGRAALFHILRGFDVRERLLVPGYICDTVLEPLRRLGIAPVFYDVDARDLNGTLDSIRQHNVRTVLAASLYGNPADLAAMERFCREQDRVLIDDAAQSFGAM